ncbi:Uncharacterised protein [Serratia marcescens]|nr:Uncharacterised protein [Serratia marcescens]
MAIENVIKIMKVMTTYSYYPHHLNKEKFQKYLLRKQ